jgi:hypothetical protein
MVSEPRPPRLIPMFAVAAWQARRRALEIRALHPQFGPIHPLAVVVSSRISESLIARLMEFSSDVAADVAVGAVGLEGFR